MDFFRKLFAPKPIQRLPQRGGQIIALSGAVMIHTYDKNTIVITPQLARHIAAALPHIADQAERNETREKFETAQTP